MKNIATLLLVFLITFGCIRGYSGQSKTNYARLKRSAPSEGLIYSPQSSFGSPYYTDNFDGANDTTSLKARGYKVHYRGTGTQAAPTWQQGAPGTFPSFNGPSNGYVYSNYLTVTDVNDIDNWLILPAQNVQEGDTLYFYSRSPDGSTFPDSIRVMYSAAGDSLPEGSWVELGRFKVTTAGSWERRGFHAPSAAAGARFAIRYAVANGGPNGSNSDYVGIDALTIERPGILNDVGVSGNVAPAGTVQINTTMAPKALIRNLGTGNQSVTSPFNVAYSISPGGYSSTKTITSLSSGSSVTVTFDSTFTPGSSGVYTFIIITDLGSDENRSNDTLRGSFNVAELNWGGGGPNSGGYYFANSLSVGAPSRPGFGWIDPISSGHTEAVFVPNSDDGRKSVDMGFPFTYFGTLFPSGAMNLNIFTNGFLTFGTPGSASIFGANTIPSGSNPANMIAPCILDLDLTPAMYPTAKVYYGGDAGKFVVTYFHVYAYVPVGVSTDYITFQIIFYPNGNIKIQYDDTESSVPPGAFLNQADIGIQNASGSSGLQYRVNGTGGPIFGSPLALEFGTNPNALPVQLSAFTGHVRQSAIRLDWTTLSELNNYGFYIERRTSGQQHFTTLPNSFTPGHGTTLEPHEYSFLDNTLSGQASYDYRLRQVDLDGAEHTSDPITVAYSPTTVKESAPREFTLYQNYPNPFNPSTQIKFSVEETNRTTLQLYNVVGQKIAILFDATAEAGQYYTINFRGDNLSSGVYFYRLQSGSHTVLKKLMLLR